MGNVLHDSNAVLKKIRIKTIFPFIIWPVVFLATFFLIYSNYENLYMKSIEYKGASTANSITDTFLVYLNNVDTTLKSCARSVEYMLEENASKEEIHDYLKYESEKLLIVSSTGSRGIFGIIDGTLMNGIEWNPAPDYDPTQREWYQVAFRNQGRYGFSTPHISSRTNEYVVTACKLLEDGESVIALAIDYETFKSMTTDLVKSDDSRIVLIMNDRGVVIASSAGDEKGVDYSVYEDQFQREIYGARMHNQGKGTFTLNGKSFGGSDYIISQRHILYDLNVLTITDADEELAELKRLAYSLGIILFLAGVLVLVFNQRRMIKDMIALDRAQSLKSLAKIYASMFKINMERDTSEQIICNDYRISQVMESGQKRASQAIREMTELMVDKRSLDDMLSFTNLATLSDRFKESNSLTIEFLSAEHIWKRARFILVEKDELGKLISVILATEVIDEEKRARERLQYLADIDQLTGINNRGSGEQKIRDLLQLGVGGMFLLFDVDKFKGINDTYGHNVGDKVLIEIAGKMKQVFRDRDIVMRLGGDEFAAYVPGVYSEEKGRPITQRLIRAIHSIDIEALAGYTINISVGAAFYFTTDTFAFDDLYKRADLCTYESKKVEGSFVTFHKRLDGNREDNNNETRGET
jgi:diguanylate cyclase (GGDEF)-like protein